jgi:serine/threonine-protein kinase
MATPSKLSSETFLGLVKQCGLVEVELLKKNWKEMKELGISLENPRQIADEFVKRNLLTRWQADKLLQGKHKGFFLGKYRLISLLGSGGMSQVYLAEHILMRRRVAIKVLPKGRVDDSSYLERFHREAQAVAALDHRNIVRAYDVDQDKGTHFLVMEYVPGQSLHELVVKNGPVDFVAAAEYMRQAAEGLQHAHRIGMVHRDIKPGNLLLDEKGIVKLLDLGLARFFDDKDENSLTVKHDEKVLGTADFLSPEQALNSHTVDGRSDIYSLGCTLYHLLTGHPPFPDGTLAQRLLAHQTKMPRPVQEERPDIPAGLLAILNRMIAKNPDERFQSARDAAQELLQWLTEFGGAGWARMNPPVSGASQIFTDRSGLDKSGPGSTANVLAREIPTANARAGQGAEPRLVADSAGGEPTAGMPPSDSQDFLGNPFASQATVAASMAAPQEDTGNPELAALFSHLASEGSTKISRAPKAPLQPQLAKALPAEPQQIETVAEPAPAASEFEATIAVPQFLLPDEQVEPAAPTEMLWPTAEFTPTAEFAPADEFAATAEFKADEETMPANENMPTAEFISLEPEPPAPPTEFVDTFLASQQIEEPWSAALAAAIEAPANPPPVAPRIAEAAATPIARPVATPVTATSRPWRHPSCGGRRNRVRVAARSSADQVPRCCY